ncbi:MAG: ABC transporter permease [Sphingobacteriales bacterium]|nr:ABC transporter permease [Sphingobacteriales bacterium]
MRNKIRDLYISSQAGKINNQLKLIAADINADSTLQATVGTQLKTLENNYKQMVDGATPAQNYVPSVVWYGTKNQYHRWIRGFVKGDFGISYLDNRPVASKIWDALRWTITINLISLLVSYILAIFLGVWSAVRKGTKADQIVTTALFVLYSLPSFWIGTMLIVFFTSPEYGMNLFPPGQVTSLPLDAPFLAAFCRYWVSFNLTHYLYFVWFVGVYFAADAGRYVKHFAARLHTHGACQACPKNKLFGAMLSVIRCFLSSPFLPLFFRQLLQGLSLSRLFTAFRAWACCR